MSSFDPRNDYWSLDEDETLARLWDEGVSVNGIALELNKRSRNAIAGRARRLGLPMRCSPIPFHQPSRGRELAAGFLAAREAISAEATRATYYDYLTDRSLSDDAFEIEFQMARFKSRVRAGAE